MTKEIFPQLYLPDRRDREIFGDHYSPPAEFPHGHWVTVARIESSIDGQPVEIDEARYPARFFRMRAIESKNSAGEIIPAWTLSTGSGDECGKLIMQLAEMVAAGMVAM